MSPKKPAPVRRPLVDPPAAPAPQLDPTEGRKFDAGKPRFSLFPVEALNPILQVLEFGAKKYAEGNWRYVENGRVRYADALHRHYVDHLMGKKNDEESGLPILAHMATDAIFLLALDIKDRLS